MAWFTGSGGNSCLAHLLTRFLFTGDIPPWMGLRRSSRLPPTTLKWRTAVTLNFVKC